MISIAFFVFHFSYYVYYYSAKQRFRGKCCYYINPPNQLTSKRKYTMIETKFNNNVLTAFIKGEIDHDSAAKIRSEVDAAAHTLKPRVLCLDFGGVSFMDSSGVGLVMGRYRQMKLLGGALRVKNYSDSVYRIFAMSGLEALGVLQ